MGRLSMYYMGPYERKEGSRRLKEWGRDSIEDATLLALNMVPMNTGGL